jgi:hypothetical protein
VRLLDGSRACLSDARAVPSGTRRSPLCLGLLAVTVLLVMLARVEVAHPSICIASGTTNPQLRVNAQGFAEVSWTAQGRRSYRLVTPRGRVRPGVRLQGRDVSSRTAAVRISGKRVLRRTPPATFWALQTCGTDPGDPPSLRFSRWKGTPTRLTGDSVCCRSGRETLVGRATFHEIPIYGWVYVDCFRCPLNTRGWARATRKATTKQGYFSVPIPSAWKGRRYRLTVIGPNFGWTRAPDAVRIVPAALN